MADARSELSWLLDDLANRVAGVRHAILLSADGLTMGGTQGLTREDTEHLAAIAAGSHSLADLYKRALDSGEPAPVSGRQEQLENIVARHVERAR